MVKKRRLKHFRRPSSRPLDAGAGICRLLASMGGSPGRARLFHLWENWRQTVGDDLGALALPLGCHKDTLLIGARDSMEIMELTMQSPEILERVNAFLQCRYFSKVRVSLERGRDSLGVVSQSAGMSVENAPAKPGIIFPSGKFLGEMDMSSPVARCYALFARGRGR